MKDNGRHGDLGNITAREGGTREAATALLYLPGLGERSDVFAGLIASPELAGFRHIALDYVDWTRPLPAGEDVSFEAVADRLAAWIEAHVKQPIVLLGHSMGGVIASILAERHPVRVAKLVDIEGNISSDDCTFSGKVVACPREEFVARGFEELRGKLSAPSADPATRAYADELRGCDPTAYYDYSVPLVRASHEDKVLVNRLAALPMDILYVGGSDPERGISLRSRQLLSEARVKVKLIEGAGHWPYLDQPARFIAVLRAFIGSE